MKLAIHTASGQSGELDVSSEIFESPFNEALLHQVMTSYQANGHVFTAKQKNRSEVSGGGAKPWRQKGTGRARAGTSRGPIWRSGGVTFASRPREVHKKVNRKVYRCALRIVFAELIRQSRLQVVDGFALSATKTSELAKLLKGWGEVNRVLLLTHGFDSQIYLTSRNLPEVAVCDVNQLDLMWLISAKRVYITESALKAVEGQLQ